MTVLAITRIIELSLEITLEIIRGMPAEQRAAFWERRAKRMEWWENLLERLFNREEADKPTPAPAPKPA